MCFQFFLCFLFHCVVCFVASANDSTYEKRLIERIYKAQSTGNKEFAKGLFPSYREYYFNRGTYKNDDNIFFTALIAATLQHLEPALNSESKKLLDSIIS